jgi:Mlc titration factor MtfA (ptsG expression regulator)
MSTLLIIVGIALVAFATWLLRRRARALHFRQLAGMPLDAELVDLLRQHMPLYERMPSQLQLRLQGLVNVFLNDKSFFGSGGLEITDEMRLAVAGNACLLLLNQDAPPLPGLQYYSPLPQYHRHPDSEARRADRPRRPVCTARRVVAP